MRTTPSTRTLTHHPSLVGCLLSLKRYVRPLPFSIRSVLGGTSTVPPQDTGGSWT